MVSAGFIIIELQLRITGAKHFSWPLHAAVVHGLRKCPTYLVVVPLSPMWRANDEVHKKQALRLGASARKPEATSTTIPLSKTKKSPANKLLAPRPPSASLRLNRSQETHKPQIQNDEVPGQTLRSLRLRVLATLR